MSWLTENFIASNKPDVSAYEGVEVKTMQLRRLLVVLPRVSKISAKSCNRIVIIECSIHITFNCRMGSFYPRDFLVCTLGFFELVALLFAYTPFVKCVVSMLDNVRGGRVNAFPKLRSTAFP